MCLEPPPPVDLTATILLASRLRVAADAVANLLPKVNRLTRILQDLNKCLAPSSPIVDAAIAHQKLVESLHRSRRRRQSPSPPRK